MQQHFIQTNIFLFVIRLFFEESNVTNTILSYETDITTMVLRGDTHYAYVIRESKFNALVKNKHIWNIIYHFGRKIYPDELELCTFMKPIFSGQEHISYKVWIRNTLINRFDIVIQRLVEHGIVAYLKEESIRILGSESTSPDKMVSNRVDSVSLHDIQDTFLILIVGLLLAILSLLIEYLIVYRRPNHRFITLTV